MSQKNNESAVAILAHPDEKSMFPSVTLFVLAIIYVLSPIDIIPDVPVVGHVDDLFVAAIATLNLMQKWFEGSSIILALIFKWFKWLVVLVGLIAISIAGLAFYGIVKLVSG